MKRFAVIGSNFVTDWLLDASKETELAKPAAVYSRTEERGREYAAQHGIDKVYTSLDDLAKDPEIDFVYIASPNSFHAPQAIRMLNAGKGVLCEKPIAPDDTTLEAMMDAARKSNKPLMEAMVPAHLPVWLEIRELAKDIAPIRRATFTFCQYSSRYDKFKAGIIENAFRPELANGALMDLGVYCLHAAQLVFGSPDSVNASMVRIPGSIDGAGTISLTYSRPDALTGGGCIADIQYSKISQGTAPCELQGENGSLIIDSITRPVSWKLIPRSGKRSDGLAMGGSGLEPRTMDVKPPRHPMVYELEDFARAMDKGFDESLLYNSRAVTRVMDEARRQTGLEFVVEER